MAWNWRRIGLGVLSGGLSEVSEALSDEDEHSPDNGTIKDCNGNTISREEAYNNWVNCYFCNNPNAGSEEYQNYIKNALADYNSHLRGCNSDVLGFNEETANNINSGFTAQMAPITTNAKAAEENFQVNEDTRQACAKAQQLASINAGMNSARAGLLGDTNTSNTMTGMGGYSSSIANQGSTQADYLNKMSQAIGAECCAANMKNGAFYNTIDAALQGAGSGASLGASLGG